MKMKKSTALMTPDEIVLEIKEVRGELEHNIERLFELSRVLYAKARRNNDDTDNRRATMVLYANAWTRFVGVVGQGLRRTSSADRVLKVAQQQEQDRQERERRDKERDDRETQRVLRQATNPIFEPSPGVEDLVALYGPEVMDYASR
jgi:hypothetical protein